MKLSNNNADETQENRHIQKEGNETKENGFKLRYKKSRQD